LKSGNFGGTNFFSRAFEVLETMPRGPAGGLSNMRPAR
jgi:hypothetical protein